MLERGDFSGPGRAPALRPVAKSRARQIALLAGMPRLSNLWLPDMRVQRTRRLASLGCSLRSLGPPLTRWPLGRNRK